MRIARIVVSMGAIALAVPLLASCSESEPQSAAAKVWVAAPDSSAVTVIDAATKNITTTIKFPGAPSGLALDGDSVWAADRDGRTLWQVDQASDAILNEVKLREAPNPPAPPSPASKGNSSAGAVVVANGQVIVANALAGTITYVDASSRSILRTVDIGPDPYALAVSGDALWISHRSNGTVTRHRLADGSQTASVSVGGSPRGLVATDGAIWAMNQGVQEVARIATATNKVAAKVSVTSLTSFGTIHAGKLWVTADDKLVEINTTENKVTDETRIGRFNFDIVSVDASNVWVTDSAKNVAYQVDPIQGNFDGKVTAGLHPTHIVTNAAEQTGGSSS